MKTGKLIIISAPSGSGKSTIIGRLMQKEDLRLEFSISATTRKPRGTEEHGVHYYFLEEDDFRQRIERGEFAEYQEVYAGRFYGTLKSEIDRITANGNNVVLDVDVLGGLNVKEIYGDHALSIYIKPPSIEVLRQRLLNRSTDSMEDIENRVAKASFELGFVDRFDACVVNDNLDEAVLAAEKLIRDFIAQ